jgi:hypothetical protein
MDQSNREPAK